MIKFLIEALIRCSLGVSQALSHNEASPATGGYSLLREKYSFYPRFKIRSIIPAIGRSASATHVHPPTSCSSLAASLALAGSMSAKLVKQQLNSLLAAQGGTTKQASKASRKSRRRKAKREAAAEAVEPQAVAATNLSFYTRTAGPSAATKELLDKVGRER